MAERYYKLELVNPDNEDRVAFGPRQPGDVGKDILIVKHALGTILTPPLTEGEGIIDPNGWFDCVTGKTISNIEAATFDKKLQSYITKFQLDNQFYILSYLFTKFAIPEQVEAINLITRSEVEEKKAVKKSVMPLWLAQDIPTRPIPAGMITIAEDNISTYREHGLLAQQIDVIARLYDAEFGRLGEATLAVLHGWRPRTQVGLTSYYHDSRVFPAGTAALDVCMLGLYDSFVRNDLAQTLQTSEDIIEPRFNSVDDYRSFTGAQAKGMALYRIYLEQVSLKERISIDSDTNVPVEYRFKSNHFAVLKYRLKNKSEKSLLYQAFEAVSETPFSTERRDARTLSSKDYSDSMARILEPNHLVDPPPFILSDTTIGYFAPTEYTLTNLPPSPPRAEESDQVKKEYLAKIRQLEDSALSDVLGAYEKPDIFYLDPTEPTYQEIFTSPGKAFDSHPITDVIQRPFHNGEIGKRGQWVLTTKTAAATRPELEILETSAAQVYFELEYDHTRPDFHTYNDQKPLIQFVEFYTPSLRPGDVYRAKFIVNKRKLDYISDGISIEQLAQITPGATTAGLTAEDAATAATDNSIEIALDADCEENIPNAEEERRRYEAYRSLAAKRKREIARILREKTLENHKNQEAAHAIDVDLGVFGNANLNFDKMSKDGYQAAKGAVAAAGSLTNYLMEQKNAPNPDISKLGELKMTYPDLENRIETAVKNTKDAYKATLGQNIKYNDPTFNGASLAGLLSGVPADLRAYIKKNITGAQKVNFGRSENLDRETMGAFIGHDTPILSRALSESSKPDIIHIKFAPAEEIGMKIIGIKVAGSFIDVSPDKLKQQAPSLSNPITVTWLANVYEMSGGDYFPLGWLSSAGDSCRDIGPGNYGLAYLTRFTPGLKGKIPEYNPVHQWYTEGIETPVKKWWAQSRANHKSDMEADFNVDELLKAMGKECKFIDLKREFLNRKTLTGLLCDYLRCFKLPGLTLKIPNFNIPARPKIAIFGWYKGLVNFIIDNWKEILRQFLCVFFKTILDFLKVPFCQEQLRDQLFGGAASHSPIVQAALIDGLTDLGISPDSVEASKEFIDETMTFLTGAEICRLINGEQLDSATMNMIEKLAQRKGIKDLNSEEAIRNFFDTIGIFVPDGFCDTLRETTSVIGSASCSDTTSYLDQVRRSMLANDATDDEIQKAVDMASKNRMDTAQALEAFGEKGMEGLMPPMLDFGDPNAIISDFPTSLSTSIIDASKDMFNAAKTGYVSSLTAFGPSLYFNSQRLPRPDEPAYNEESHIIVESILESLRLFTVLGKQAAGSISEISLIKQLHVLYQIYEIKKYKGGRRIISTYEAAHQDGSESLGQEKFYLPPDTRVFDHVPWDSRGSHDGPLYLKPVGYSEYGFYLTDENGIVTNLGPSRDDASIFDLGTMKLTSAGGTPSALEGFSFINEYKMQKRAERDNVLSMGDTRSFLQKKIGERLEQLQISLDKHLRNISSPMSEALYLSRIRDILDSSLESDRERRGADNQTIKIGNSSDDHQTLDLNFSFGRLSSGVRMTEYRSLGQNQAFAIGSTGTNEFDPYVIDIYSNNLFDASPDNPQRFEFCDIIPGPDGDTDTIYSESIRDIPAGLYTRRELFSRRYLASIDLKTRKYFGAGPGQSLPLPSEAAALESLRGFRNQENPLRIEMYEDQYPEYLEGIFEQVFYSLRNSRMFDESGYAPDLRRRVNGEVYFSPEDNCYKNRYNVPQFGALSFEKVVTDEIAAQIKREMSKPENSPYNIDYNKPTGIEKAIQNVCLIGFVRVCLIELLLKGALAYSVWDIEGVLDEPLMQEYLFRYIEHEIGRKPSMKRYWEEVVVRVTGIEQPQTALKRLVYRQSLKLQDLSKKVYLNPSSSEAEYYNWFASYFIPETEVSKTIPAHQRTWAMDWDGRQRRDEGPERIVLTRVDTEGQVTEDDQEVEDTRFISPGFTWMHPLADPSNIVVKTIPGSWPQERSTLDISEQALKGNDPFFHIEHLLEVNGPLAALESILFPTRDIINSIVAPILPGPGPRPEQNNIPGAEELEDKFGEDNAPAGIITSVQGRRPENLNIIDSRARLTNLAILDQDLYLARSTPELLAGSRGSSREIEDIMHAKEIYHIDDFVHGLKSALNADDLEKYMFHLKGQMHYDPSYPGPDGPWRFSVRDTNIEAAEGYPETIRRTPTRFIKKTRRIVKFQKDIFSHPYQELYSGTGNIRDYLKNMSAASVGRFLGYGSLPAAADNIAQIKSDVGLTGPTQIHDRGTKYYVLPTNGENLLGQLAELGLLDLSTGIGDAGIFLNNNTEYFLDHLKIKPESIFASNQTAISVDTLDDLTNFRDIGLVSRAAERGADQSREARDQVADGAFNLGPAGSKFLSTVQLPGGNRGITTDSSLQDIPRDARQLQPKNIIDPSKDHLEYADFLPDERPPDKKTIFANKMGQFSSEAEYDDAKIWASARWDTPLEEEWIETVYDFSGPASILAGVFGSFTIGETFDPAVLNFEPTQALINAFEFRLKPFIEMVDGAAKWNKVKVTGLADPDLASYGRTFFTRDPLLRGDIRGQPLPYLTRPMGIDKYTNKLMTAPLHVHEAQANSENRFVNALKPFSASDDPAASFLATQAGTFGNICKILHSKPRVEPGGAISPSIGGQDLLPPNFYKIPLRILLTQVVIGGEIREVYCRVVPTKYIKNMHNPDLYIDNIARLNQAIVDIIDEYQIFIREVQAQLPGAPAINPSRPWYQNRMGNPQYFPEFTQDFHKDFSEANTYKRSALGPTSQVQYCSIERIYSEAFALDTGEDTYNSEDELDALFGESRGYLIKKKNVFPREAYLEKLSESERITQLGSYNFFYDVNIPWSPGDQDISNFDFQRTMFSINNVLAWYLRHRRSDSLWGALVRKDPISENQIRPTPAPRPPIGQKLYIASVHAPDKQTVWSADLSDALLPYKSALKYRRKIPQRSAAGAGGAANVNQDSFYVGRAQGAERQWLYQPGVLTLSHNSAWDSEHPRMLASDENLVLDINNIDKYFLKNDFTSEHPRDLLISDGPGDYYVNYNAVESNDFLKDGSSMFAADGRVSQADIATFMQATLKKFIFSVSGELPDALNESSLEDYFDYDKFFTAKNVLIIKKLLSGGENREGFEILPEVYKTPTAMLNTSITGLEDIKNMFITLAKSVSLISAQNASYSVESEASYDPGNIFCATDAAYKFESLRRFLSAIPQSLGFHEKLFLLSLASTRGFAETMVDSQSLHSAASASAMVPWAKVCLYYMHFMIAWHAGENDPGRIFRGTSFYRLSQFLLERRAGAGVHSAGDGFKLNDSSFNLTQGLVPGNLMRHGVWHRMQGIRLRDMNAFLPGERLNPDGALTLKDIIDMTHQAHRHLVTRGSHANAFIQEGISESYTAILEFLMFRSPGIDEFRFEDIERPAGRETGRHGVIYSEALWQEAGRIATNASGEDSALKKYQEAISGENVDIIMSQYQTSRDKYKYLYAFEEDKIVKPGRMQDILQVLDSNMYFRLFYENNEGSNTYFRSQLTSMGYFEGIPEGTEQGSAVEHKHLLLKNSLVSPITLKTRVQRILQHRNIHYDNIQRIKARWVQAFDTKTGIGESLNAGVFESAIIGGNLIKGLLRSSEIKQVARLVANTPATHTGTAMANLMENSVIKKVSSEERSFLMNTSEGEGSYIHSVPMAEYFEFVSTRGTGTTDDILVNCFDINTLKVIYKVKRTWMTQQLLEKEESKVILKYIFPVKRFQAISTVFATEALASYSTMPTIMQAPKASLASLMNIAGLNPKEKNEILNSINQPELLKQMIDNKVSDIDALKCIEWPQAGEFLEQWWNALKQMIIEFPAIFFRGIASVVDPAYKEMKLHWQNCDIDKLTWAGVQGATTIDERKMTAGLMGSPDGKKDSTYAMVIPSSLTDIGVGLYRVTSTLGSDSAWTAFGRALERTSGYIYKGPLSLMDGVFEFGVPCMDAGGQWPDEAVKPWNADRYGHPLSPLTAIALSMIELNGDKTLRERSGCPDNEEAPNSFTAIALKSCEDASGPDAEPKPFGPMPPPEDES